MLPSCLVCLEPLGGEGCPPAPGCPPGCRGMRSVCAGCAPLLRSCVYCRSALPAPDPVPAGPLETACAVMIGCAFFMAAVSSRDVESMD